MTVNCVWELQQAIYAALDGDSALSNLVTGVFDHVPQDTDYPYVTIGEMRGVDYSTKTTDGSEVNVVVNTFTRGKGSKQALDVIDRVNVLLHDANLSLATCTLVNMRRISSEIVRRPDGLTYQGVVRFRAVVEA